MDLDRVFLRRGNMNIICRNGLLVLSALMWQGCDSPDEIKPVVFNPSITMREVQPGKYTRVTNTRQQVTLTRGFWIGINEITQQQYESVTGSNPSFYQGDSFPVEKVSFMLANEFCNKLTQRDRKAGRIPMNLAYRLPTEAEWEYACLAGANTAFSFGDSEDDANAHFWSAENAEDQSQSVGKKIPNAWGLYDMHGNVWEWVADWFAPHPAESALVDPVGPITGKHRVFKGGGWYHEAKFARSTSRFMMEPGMSINYVGFRVVLSEGVNKN